MESIENWIENKGSYAEGLALYATIAGMKPTLLKLFTKGETAQNREKLIYELKKSITAKSKTEIVASIDFGVNDHVVVAGITKDPKTDKVTVFEVINKQAPATTSEPELKNTLLFHQLPPELREDLMMATNLFKENCLLKVQLNELLPEQDSEALQLQLQIFANLKKNGLHWQRIDYWQTHKRLPAPLRSKTTILNPTKQAKRQQYLFSSRGKLRKRLEQNILLLETTTNLKERTRLEKAIARQTANLLQQEHELQELTALIDKLNE